LSEFCPTDRPPPDAAASAGVLAELAAAFGDKIAKFSNIK
jgi:hypothetical protein